MKHSVMWKLLVLAACACLAAGAIAAIAAAPENLSRAARGGAMLDCIARGQPRAYCETLMYGSTALDWTFTIYYALSGAFAALVFGGLATILGQVEQMNHRLTEAEKASETPGVWTRRR